MEVGRRRAVFCTIATLTWSTLTRGHAKWVLIRLPSMHSTGPSLTFSNPPRPRSTQLMWIQVRTLRVLVHCTVLCIMYCVQSHHPDVGAEHPFDRKSPSNSTASLAMLYCRSYIISTPAFPQILDMDKLDVIRHCRAVQITTEHLEGAEVLIG